MDADSIVARAHAALEREADRASDAEPFKGALLRACAAIGTPRDPSSLLAFWSSREPGSPRSEARYRWEISHRVGVAMPPWAPDKHAWHAWRAGEEARARNDIFEFESRLVVPMIATENVELLASLRDDPRAAALLGETAAILRRDFARHVQMNEAWEDTFALWCVVRRPHALALLHPIAVAVAACYAAGRDGPVRGARFPYFDRPLASASAQLASALLTLGSDLELVAKLGEFVSQSRAPSGAWGDAGDPEDVLTTLACADLLSQIDPTFDAGPTVRWLASVQRHDGLFAALGPDAPWLTAEVAAWASSAMQPFDARFRWPHRSIALSDLKTGLPSFAYFVELASLFRTLPGLAATGTDVAFIDLIGFRAFNNRFGQDAGDEVLRVFGAAVSEIPSAATIRDGGDEFLVVGAPCRRSLLDDLDAFRKRWPALFVARFGEVPPVAPRILVRRGECGELRAMRERLGQEITTLKGIATDHEGILRESAPQRISNRPPS